MEYDVLTVGAGIRIVCISDTHSRHGNMLQLPPGDVLIHAGDFTNTGSRRDTEEFVAWMDAQPYKHKIFIAGNHDTSLHTSYYIESGAERFHRGQKEISPLEYSTICRDLVLTCESTYLEDSGTTLTFEIPQTHMQESSEGSIDAAANIGANLTDSAQPQDLDAGEEMSLGPLNVSHACFEVYGSPWQPEFCDWAFNLDRGEPCAAKWAAIPDNLDILITHGPPYGYGDKTFPSGMRAGCQDLLKRIKESEGPPRVHIFGHIHEDEGTCLLEHHRLYIILSIVELYVLRCILHLNL